MYQRVIVVGNLGKDPEVKFLPSGMAVCSFSVATSRKWKEKASGELKEETEWFNVEVFGAQAEPCGQYLAKGRKVLVEGRMKTNIEEKNGVKKYWVKLIADSVKFLESKGDKDGVAPVATAQEPQPDLDF